MPNADVLTRLPAKPIQRLLVALRDIRRRNSAGEDVLVPLTSLHLANGTCLRGWLLDLGEDKDQGAALFQLEGPDRHGAPDVAYVDVSSIASVVVHDAAKAAHLISFGAVEAPVGPAPTSLELKRRLQKLGEELSSRVGKPIACEATWSKAEESPDALRRLGVAIGDLSALLLEIAGSDIGREALESGVARVSVSVGPGNVARADSALVVPVPPTDRPAMPRAELKTAIEAAL